MQRPGSSSLGEEGEAAQEAPELKPTERPSDAATQPEPELDLYGHRTSGPLRSQSSFRARMRGKKDATMFRWETRGHFWSELDKASAPLSPSQQQRGLRGGLARAWATTTVRAKNTLTVLRLHPLILVMPLLLCGVCIGLGIFGVHMGAEAAKRSHRANGEAAATKVAAALRLTLERSVQPVRSMDPIVQLRANMTLLGPGLPRFARTVLRQALPNTVLQLVLAPFGIVRAMHPPQPGDRGGALGAELFAEADRERVMRSVPQQDILLGTPHGPLASYLPSPGDAASGRYLAAHHPVYLYNVSDEETWGNGPLGGLYTKCGEACYNGATGAKLWGFVSLVLDVPQVLLQSSSGLAALRRLGYAYRLSMPVVPAPGYAPVNVVIAESDPPPSGEDSGVSIDVDMVTSTWTLEAYPYDGWEPRWVHPLIAVVVCVSVVMALLLFLALVIHARHLMLLEAMLPKKVIHTLSTGRSYYEHFESVTVLYADIVRYSNAPTGMEPWEVVKLLNDVNNMYDALLEKHGLIKIRRSGEAFMGVGGCPHSEDPVKAAVRVAMCAREMVVATTGFRSSAGQRVQIRIGLHSGPVVAAVVGTQMPRFSLFGETIDIAQFVEATSAIMGVHVSDTTADLLHIAADPLIVLQPRGVIDVKGRGPMTTSWLRVNLLVPMSTTIAAGDGPDGGVGLGPGGGSGDRRQAASGGGGGEGPGGANGAGGRDGPERGAKHATIATMADLAVAAAMGVQGAPLVRKLSQTGLTRALPERRGGGGGGSVRPYDDSLLGSFTMRLEPDTVKLVQDILAGRVDAAPAVVKITPAAAAAAAAAGAAAAAAKRPGTGDGAAAAAPAATLVSGDVSVSVRGGSGPAERSTLAADISSVSAELTPQPSTRGASGGVSGAAAGPQHSPPPSAGEMEVMASEARSARSRASTHDGGAPAAAAGVAQEARLPVPQEEGEGGSASDRAPSTEEAASVPEVAVRVVADDEQSGIKGGGGERKHEGPHARAESSGPDASLVWGSGR